MPAYDLTLEEERETFHRGVARFNEGQFFEAHDTWEEIWSRVRDRRRERFYQAMIQSAVTLELLRRGRAVGVRQVFVSALALFEGLPPVFMGLEIAGFLTRLRHAIAPTLDDLDARHVPIDPTRLFTISLQYDPFVEPRHGEISNDESP